MTRIDESSASSAELDGLRRLRDEVAAVRGGIGLDAENHAAIACVGREDTKDVARDAHRLVDRSGAAHAVLGRPEHQCRRADRGREVGDLAQMIEKRLALAIAREELKLRPAEEQRLQRHDR